MMALKLIACKACGKEISSSAKTCPHCGAKNTKPLFTKWWFWAVIIAVCIGIAGGNSTSGEKPSEIGENQISTENNIVSTDKKNDVFTGDCGISAIAEMGTDIIGQPTVTVSVTNTTDKDILAVKFYAVPLNVYGEELTGIFSQNELYTDDSIPAGSSTSCTWQFLDDEVKSVKMYVYSVYFADGTQWGDKDATKSTILKKGMELEVNGVSGK